MFNRERAESRGQSRPTAPATPPAIEALEGRRLLSASFHHGHGGGDFGGGDFDGPGRGFGEE